MAPVLEAQRRSPSGATDPGPSSGPGLADVLGLLTVLGRHRRLLVRLPAAALLTGLLVAFLWPKSFTATARILPPQQSQSTAAAMLAQLGGAAAGLATGALGIKNPSDLYIGMMKSDSVADAIVTRFELKRIYDEPLQMDARRELADRTVFSSDKGGIITIRVEARDPALAAALANAYAEELQRLTSTLAVTEAAQRRLFFEQQLQRTKDKLSDAEQQLRRAIDAGGIVSVDSQSRAALETVARLRAQISAKEIQVDAMHAFATNENPDRRRAENELASMRRELDRLESGRTETSDSGPGKGIQNVKLLREVKYQEVMFELMAKQYELARVDEAKQAPLVQLLDRASPPERKSKPRRVLVIGGALLLGILSALAGAFLQEWWASARADPAQAAALRSVRSSWSGGSGEPS